MIARINDIDYIVREGDTVLDVCRRENISIPTLCHHPEMKTEARCRICIVEVDGKIKSSCNTPVYDGMEVVTDSPKIRAYRKMNFELMAAEDHSLVFDDPAGSEFARYTWEYNLPSDKRRFSKTVDFYEDTNVSLTRDSRDCILCGKCIQICKEVQGVEAIGFTHRSSDSRICPAFEYPLGDVACALCGQCANVCPTGAISEHSYIDEVKAAVADPEKTVVVQIAPAVRASIGETQAIPPGSLMTKKLPDAMKQLGFDRVLDTNFAADLTIMEEGHEFLDRLQNGGVFPMITSCSPGWIRFIEFFYPDLLPHLSSCKSPQQMFGAVVKTYYANQEGIDPENLVCVSIMPCTAKKFEMNREGMSDSGYKDVDYVLTTRELGKWLNEKHVDLLKCEDKPFDPLMGESTGAGAIFGATGGVMEAALRTVADIVSGEDLQKVDYDMVRGLSGVKEAQLDINGNIVNIAVANGLGNARKLLEAIANGTADYHFVEIMACPGGCIGGGGQPKPAGKSTLQKRVQAIYDADRGLPLRKSHMNPEIQLLYEKFLGEPGSHKSHELLHTTYLNRKKMSPVSTEF